MSIVENIKQIGMMHGETVSQIEKACGFSRASIYKWDEHSPSIDKLLIVANHFGITVDELLGIKKEVAETNLSDFQKEMVKAIQDLPPEKYQRVMDFLAGLKG